jgi:Tfp pilus assembly pilus retraction ATPase PilT
MTKNRARKRATKALTNAADIRRPEAAYQADNRKLRTPDWGMINFAEGPLRLIGTDEGLAHFRPLEVVLKAALEKQWRIVQLTFDATRPLPDMLAYLRGKPTLAIIVTSQAVPGNPVIAELLAGIHKDLNVVIQGPTPAALGDHKGSGKVIFFGVEDGVDPEPIPPRITDWYSMVDQGGAVHGPTQTVGGSPKDSPGVLCGAPEPTRLSNDFVTAINEAMQEKPDAFILSGGGSWEAPLPGISYLDGFSSGIHQALQTPPDIIIGEIRDTEESPASPEGAATGEHPGGDMTPDVPGAYASAFVKAPLSRKPEHELFVGVTGDHSSMDTRKITDVITRAGDEALSKEGPTPAKPMLIIGRPGIGRTAQGWARVNKADADLDALGVPKAAQEFATYPDGLFLITGLTFAGKTTTGLALMRRAHADKGRDAFVIMNAREALHSRMGSATVIPVRGPEENADAIRQAQEDGAEIILVDDLRESGAAEAAVTAALSGVLVFATMHSTAANAAARLMDMFPEPDGSANDEALISRAMVPRALRGVTEQVMVRGEGLHGRVMASEVWVKDDQEEAPVMAPVLRIKASLASLVAEGTVLQEAADEVSSGRSFLRS